MSAYVVRVESRWGESGHPEFKFIGPMPYKDAAALGERLMAVGRGYEIGQLVHEADLPGLFTQLTSGGAATEDK